MPPVTVQQVAEAAGVSRSTANKVLLGESHLFRETTAQKVLDAAQTLGYRPNLMARGLRERRTFLIGTLLSSVNAPLAYDLYAGIQQVAAENDCAPITFSCPDAEHENRAIHLCQDRQVDALLVNTAPRTSTPENQQLLLKLAEQGMPMIELFGRNLQGLPSIVSDYHDAGYRSTQKLIRAGLSRILYGSPYLFDELSVPTATTWYASDMYKGYRQAMQEANLQPDLAVFSRDAAGSHPILGWVPGARALLADHPETEAIVTPTQPLADAISLALHDTSVSAVPGFAQASFRVGASPIGAPDRRIHIRIRIREIGEIATRMAFQLLQGQKPEDQTLAPDISEIDDH